MKALAIDLGGTHANCAIVEDNKILLSKRLDLDSAQGLGSVLPLFTSSFRELMSEAGLATKDFAGLAMSTCGLVDSSRARILSSPKKWDDAPGVDFVGWCWREFSLPMKMENDARMALMGEAVCGSRTRLQRFGDDHPGRGHRHCRDDWRRASVRKTFPGE